MANSFIELRAQLTSDYLNIPDDDYLRLFRTAKRYCGDRKVREKIRNVEIKYEKKYRIPFHYLCRLYKYRMTTDKNFIRVASETGRKTIYRTEIEADLNNAVMELDNAIKDTLTIKLGGFDD